LPEDFDFLKNIVTTVEANSSIVGGYSVDSKRVYLAAHSAGAFMAYGEVCTNPGQFAAVVSVSGTMIMTPSFVNFSSSGASTGVRCNAPTVTSLLELHGLSDTTVPYAGVTMNTGGATVGPGDNQYDPSSQTLIGTWMKQINGCSTANTSDVTNGYNGVSYSASNTMTLYAYSNCTNSTSIQMITLAGAQHSFWLQNTQSGQGSPISTATINGIIWSFLQNKRSP
jgi:poly(3-hydroxybutyrate) depolymerase